MPEDISDKYRPSYAPDAVAPLAGIGPALPVHLLKSSQIVVDEEDIDVGVIGPLIPGQELVEELRHFKENQHDTKTETKSDTKLERDAWMTEAMPVRKDLDALKPRKFRGGLASEGNLPLDHTWFNIPGQEGLQKDRDIRRVQKIEELQKMQQVSYDLERNKEIADLVKLHNKEMGRPEKSLLELHRSGESRPIGPELPSSSFKEKFKFAEDANNKYEQEEIVTEDSDDETNIVPIQSSDKKIVQSFLKPNTGDFDLLDDLIDKTSKKKAEKSSSEAEEAPVKSKKSKKKKKKSKKSNKKSKKKKHSKKRSSSSSSSDSDSSSSSSESSSDDEPKKKKKKKSKKSKKEKPVKIAPLSMENMFDRKRDFADGELPWKKPDEPEYVIGNRKIFNRDKEMKTRLLDSSTKNKMISNSQSFGSKFSHGTSQFL